MVKLASSWFMGQSQRTDWPMSPSETLKMLEKQDTANSVSSCTTSRLSWNRFTKMRAEAALVLDRGATRRLRTRVKKNATAGPAPPMTTGIPVWLTTTVTIHTRCEAMGLLRRPACIGTTGPHHTTILRGDLLTEANTRTMEVDIHRLHTTKEVKYKHQGSHISSYYLFHSRWKCRVDRCGMLTSFVVWL